MLGCHIATHLDTYTHRRVCTCVHVAMCVFNFTMIQTDDYWKDIIVSLELK